MKIESKPFSASILMSDIEPLGGKILTPIHPLSIDSHATMPNAIPISKPRLIHPDECPESPNLSLQTLLITAFTQSEEYQARQIEYLQNKQSHLIHAILEQKQKIIAIHNSTSTMSAWQSTMDIALPLCTSIFSLYFGFSPTYSLPKIPAICASLLGFAIAGLKLGKVAMPNYLPTCHMAVCNIYMAYINPTDIFTQVANLLQVLPTISEFACNIDNNSMASDEILMKKVIQSINRELTNVTGEISRAMQMIAEKKKLFSTINDVQYLQNQIAAIGAA